MADQIVSNLSYLTGNFHECSPQFAHSEDLVLFAAGSIINLVSSTTGNIVGVFREHQHLVTAIHVQERNGTVIVHSSSVDGTIVQWNLVSKHAPHICVIAC